MYSNNNKNKTQGLCESNFAVVRECKTQIYRVYQIDTTYKQALEKKLLTYLNLSSDYLHFPSLPTANMVAGGKAPPGSKAPDKI